MESAFKKKSLSVQRRVRDLLRIGLSGKVTIHLYISAVIKVVKCAFNTLKSLERESRIKSKSRFKSDNTLTIPDSESGP